MSAHLATPVHLYVARSCSHFIALLTDCLSRELQRKGFKLYYRCVVYVCVYVCVCDCVFTSRLYAVVVTLLTPNHLFSPGVKEQHQIGASSLIV